MIARPSAHDRFPEHELAGLTEDQRDGVTCVNCNTSAGRMRPILTIDRQEPTMLLVHADTAVCVRRVARYVADLHMRLVRITEGANEALVRADGTDGP